MYKHAKVVQATDPVDFEKKLNDIMDKMNEKNCLNYKIQYQASADHYSALVIYEY